MAASRKLYDEIAAEFARQKPSNIGDTVERFRLAQWMTLRDAVARAFSNDNPRFNVQRFKDACDAE